ncbi:hypothetical protein SPF06_16545 [Sinomonas sp. JGH33]|uniref:DUF4190 domain-containing protein n=1 Tax=Sinomonas terricola TaxID=3110330 RepID=A0ABU5T9I3_9MICC|nr:hypothetical protein [Sinomonas sp. JGH33]MEA5456346.1 hypothetical protein [Sinomonas sp. JGH33]
MSVWGAFFAVAASTMLGAGCMVLFFALGVRLGAEGKDPARQRGGRALLAASRACYTVSGAAVILGVYLIIPYFHH